MELETPTAEVETLAPPVETPALDPNPPAATSLSDHADKFGPDATAPATDGATAPVIDTRDSKTGRFRPTRHRAASQKAGPADAPRIAELTKKTRTIEQERDALKAELDALKAQNGNGHAAPDPAAIPELAPAPRASAPVMEPPAQGFDRPKPKLEDFANAEDPYGELQQELTLWRLDKREFEKSQQEAATKTERDAEAMFNGMMATYAQRAQAFAKEHPDFDAVVNASPVVPLTPVMRAMLVGSDNGPALVYALGQHPDWQYEMHLLTDGKPISDQAVASAQRLLNSRVQAASTGSVASQPPPPVVPKPPNPVRTGPMTTGVESPASETGSLAAHRKSLGLSARRR